MLRRKSLAASPPSRLLLHLVPCVCPVCVCVGGLKLCGSSYAILGQAQPPLLTATETELETKLETLLETEREEEE